MTDYKLVPHFSEEELKRNYFAYTDAREALQEGFVGYVAKFEPKSTPEGNVVGFCNWTDFIPTIMPVVDYVTILVSDGAASRFYIIGQEELLGLIPEKLEKKDLPVKHIVIDDLEFDEEVRKKVLDKATLLKTIEN